MNAMDLIYGLNNVQDSYVASAGAFRQRKTKHLPKRKLWLIAALIALTLLLVGCAVVYVLRWQDFMIGQRDSLQNVFDEYHREVTATVPVSQQVLTFSGLQGSPSYQAAKEWYAYLQAYDTDGIIRKQAFQTDPEAQFPDTYPAYGVYSQEMADKLEE